MRGVLLNQSKHPNLFHAFDREFIRLALGVSRAVFLEHNERQHVPTVHTFRSPVHDLFRGVQDRVRAMLDFILPIHQRSGATHTDDLADHVLRVGRHGVAQHVRILDERRQGTTYTGALIRQRQRRLTTTDQARVTVRRARRRIEKRRARLVCGVLIIRLRIQTRQVSNAGGLHGVLAGNHIPRPQPRRHVRVVISMC